MPMVMPMKENGKRTRLMAKAPSTIAMELSTQASGKRICNMDTELKPGRTGRFMLVSTRMDTNKVTANLHGHLTACMKVGSSKTSYRE